MSEFLFAVFMFMCLFAARDNSHHGVGFPQVLCKFSWYVFFPWIYFSFSLSFLLSSQLLFKQPQLNPEGSTNQQHMLHIFKDFTFSQLKPIPSICLVSYHLIFFAFSLHHPCNCCIWMQTQTGERFYSFHLWMQKYRLQSPTLIGYIQSTFPRGTEIGNPIVSSRCQHPVW